MKVITKIALALVTFLNISFVFAHGEDKPGPHGGFIRMPGTFHTELIPEGKNKLKVFLLDMKWKNPSIKKSSLQISYSKDIDSKCKIQRNFYICTFPDSVDLTKQGELKVTAEREEQKGMEVSYPLPLKLNVVEDEHSSHH